ncbi:hypothetical protein [Streptomyces sp. XY533]|nr:hypothetical protein [Streptomyces sp. XY533]
MDDRSNHEHPGIAPARLIPAPRTEQPAGPWGVPQQRSTGPEGSDQ